MSTTPHKASPDQWHNLYQCLKLDRVPDHISITLELAARVEALEAAQPKPPPASAGPLVERVASAIHHSIDLDLEARAAIREVAAWLRYQKDPCANAWAMQMEQEAER